MMVFTTKQEASEFFEKLSEADYIFFANECLKFFNHNYNAECIGNSLRKENKDLLAANKILQSKIQVIEEDLKTSEKAYEVEKQKREEEQINELKKIKVEEEQRWKKRFEGELIEKESAYKLLNESLAASQSKSQYDKYLTDFDDRKTKFMEAAKHMEKKEEKSQENGADGEHIVQQMLKVSPFFVLEEITNRKMGDFHVKLGFEDSKVVAMIDVKNHKDAKPITDKDVNKFIKYLDDNSGVHCGILLAMKARFENKYQEYKVFKTKQDKPYIMINNLLARTHYEIPLLFGLSAIQMLVESRPIQGEEATKLVDLCIEQWGELLKSADKMESSAKKVQNEARDLIAKIKDGIEDVKENLLELRLKPTQLVEESSPTNCVERILQPTVPSLDSSPTKKPKTDEQ